MNVHDEKFLEQELANFLCKGPVTILGLAATRSLSRLPASAFVASRYMNGRGCVSIKLYSPKQVAGGFGLQVVVC